MERQQHDAADSHECQHSFEADLVPSEEVLLEGVGWLRTLAPAALVEVSQPCWRSHTAGTGWGDEGSRVHSSCNSVSDGKDEPWQSHAASTPVAAQSSLSCLPARP